MKKLNASKESIAIINSLILKHFNPDLNLTQIHALICTEQYINIANVSNRLKALGLKFKETRGSVSKLTKNPFLIGEKTNEYWLGFFLADGHLGKTSRNGIHMFNTEILHLRQFHIHNEIKLSEHIRITKNKPILTISFGDKNTYQYLSKLGVTSDKRYGFNLNFEVTWAIILGIFDGDGSVRLRGKSQTIEWKITSGNKQLLDAIYKFLVNEGFKLVFRKKGLNCNDLVLNGTKSEKLKFLEKLYSSNDWFLKYKFDKTCALFSKEFSENRVKCWEILRDKLTTTYPEMESVNV